MTTSNSIKDAALSYIHDGYSVVPIREREKRPAIEWEEFQKRIPNESEVNQWFSHTKNQLGIVCGCGSGGLIVFDFDGDGWEELFETFKRTFPDLLESKFVITGSRKMHIYVRCEELSNDITKVVRSFPG